MLPTLSDYKSIREELMRIILEITRLNKVQRGPWRTQKKSQVYSCSQIWGGSDTRLNNQKVYGLFSLYVLVLYFAWQCIFVIVFQVCPLRLFYLNNQKVNGTSKKLMRALWMRWQDQLIFPFRCSPWRLSFAGESFVCPILLSPKNLGGSLSCLFGLLLSCFLVPVFLSCFFVCFVYGRAAVGI